MSLYIPGNGRQKPVGVNLTTTDPTPIITGVAAGVQTVESIWISCAASTTLTLSLTDGTTTWPIYNSETLTANDHEAITDQHWQIFNGWSLNATAGAADRVTIIAVVSLTNQTDAGRR